MDLAHSQLVAVAQFLASKMRNVVRQQYSAHVEVPALDCWQDNFELDPYSPGLQSQLWHLKIFYIDSFALTYSISEFNFTANSILFCLGPILTNSD